MLDTAEEVKMQHTGIINPEKPLIGTLRGSRRKREAEVHGPGLLVLIRPGFGGVRMHSLEICLDSAGVCLNAAYTMRTRKEI